MKLQISESVNKKDWDAKICFAGGTIFHSSIWADYTVAGNANCVPQYFTLLSDDGEFLGAALGFQDSSPHKLLKRFTRSLWFDAMPLVRSNDEENIYEFFRLIENQARRTSCVHLLMGSYASRDASSDLEKLGFKLIRRLEFEVGLDRSEEDLWRMLRDTRRKKIKKALRMGVIIEDLPIEIGIPELRRLQVESAQRILKRGGPDVSTSLQYGEDPIKVLVESGYGRIVGARVAGEVVSTFLFNNFNNLVYPIIGWHHQTALETQAPTLLLWENIKRYRNEGAKKFNLGGCKSNAVDEGSPEHGVYMYKKDFGGECLQRSSGEKILHKTMHKAMNVAKSMLHR
jgi:hypothetical protein